MAVATSSFIELIDRVRTGEADAAAELVQRYEPAIRRTVRVHMVDVRLRRVFDSMDVCQSVLGSFFVRAALGQYEIDTPEKLLKLLVTMARNKLADHARQIHAERRDMRRSEPVSGHDERLVSPEPSPSERITAADLLVHVRRRLTTEERYLAEQRATGRPWSELAAELNTSAEALRKRLMRAIQQALHELGVESMSP